MVLPEVPIATIRIKFDEQYVKNKNRIEQFELLRQPVEDIRRDLNTKESNDLWAKFVTVSKLLRLLESELILGIIDTMKPLLEEWAKELEKVRFDIEQIQIKRVQA